MAWFGKKEVKKPRNDNVGDPFAIPDDDERGSVTLDIFLNEPPVVYYNLHADTEGRHGSFAIEFSGEVKRAIGAPMFQGMHSYITINRFGGLEEQDKEIGPILGGLSFHERDGGFEANLEVRPSLVADLVTLIQSCKPDAVQESALRVQLGITNELRYGSEGKERQIYYSVTGLTCWHETEFLEIEPWQPEDK